MRSLKSIIIVTLLVLSAGLFGASIVLFLNPSTIITRTPVLDGNPEVVRACNFLIANYNSTYNLVSETSAHEKYWIYSDNWLASIVLYPICKRMDLATNITRTLANYPHGKFPNQYQTLTYNASNFNASKDVKLSDSIWTTVNNQTGILSPNDYSDIAFLESYYYTKWTVNVTGAQKLLSIGANMYDGTGLVDRSFNGQYQTYKLALYMVAAMKLNETIPFSVILTLGRMQDVVGGGFYTGYYGNYSTIGTTTNAETTALAIMALANLTRVSNYIHSDLVEQVNSLAYSFAYAAIGTAMSALISLVVVAIRQRRRV